MIEHTPGPWTAEIKGNGGYAVFAPGGLACIAEVFTGVTGASDNDATADNANLMAAAPLMLAALEAVEPILRKNLYPCPDKPNSDWAKYEQLAAALKAAKGE